MKTHDLTPAPVHARPALRLVRRDRRSFGYQLSLEIFYEPNRRLLSHQTGRPLLEAIEYDENPQCGFS